VEVEGVHGSHFTLPFTITAITELKIPTNYLIGMTHEFNHDNMNERLSKLYDTYNLKVQLAYDGQIIPLCLK